MKGRQVKDDADSVLSHITIGTVCCPRRVGMGNARGQGEDGRRTNLRQLSSGPGWTGVKGTRCVGRGDSRKPSHENSHLPASSCRAIRVEADQRATRFAKPVDERSGNASEV